MRGRGGELLNQAMHKGAATLRQVADKTSAKAEQIADDLETKAETREQKSYREKYYSEIDSVQVEYSGNKSEDLLTYFQNRERADRSGDVVGVSSNSMVINALAKMPYEDRKKVLKHFGGFDEIHEMGTFGSPAFKAYRHLRDPFEIRYPHDYSDLRRCEISYALAPPCLQEKMTGFLESGRQVVERRYGSLEQKMDGPSQEVKNVFKIK